MGVSGGVGLGVGGLRVGVDVGRVLYGFVWVSVSVSGCVGE